MGRILFNELTGRFVNVQNKVERLEAKVKSARVQEDRVLLRSRLNKAQKEYGLIHKELADYISYIPNERTRECMRLTYFESKSREYLRRLYDVDLAVINRELVSGRQIVTALHNFKHKEKRKR